MQILIENKTDNTISVKLYPKEKYINPYVENSYRCTDFAGRYGSIEFVLYPNEGRVLFSSYDVNIDPYILALRVFDSIHISSTNKDNVIIKFTHECVVGYLENIFTENSKWNFSIEDAEGIVKGTIHTFNNYIFSILENKMNLNQQKQ